MKGMKFHDVSIEMWREYNFGNGDTYRIEEPMKLNIKRRADGLDSHRVVDSKGTSHYIRPGWFALKWASRDPETPFLNISGDE